MKEKDEFYHQQNIILFCEKAINESKKICDEILDVYKGDSKQKKFLKEISRMIQIDKDIKIKMENLNFDDFKQSNIELDKIDSLLNEKFDILKLLTDLDS